LTCTAPLTPPQGHSLSPQHRHTSTCGYTPPHTDPPPFFPTPPRLIGCKADQSSRSRSNPLPISPSSTYPPLAPRVPPTRPPRPPGSSGRSTPTPPLATTRRPGGYAPHRQSAPRRRDVGPFLGYRGVKSNPRPSFALLPGSNPPGLAIPWGLYWLVEGSDRGVNRSLQVYQAPHK